MELLFTSNGQLQAKLFLLWFQISAETSDMRGNLFVHESNITRPTGEVGLVDGRSTVHHELIDSSLSDLKRDRTLAVNVSMNVVSACVCLPDRLVTCPGCILLLVQSILVKVSSDVAVT